MISPERPERVAKMAAKQKHAFPILWDEDSHVAQAFGLAFNLPVDLKQVYVSLGVDLAEFNGDPSWRLPVPARFVVDQEGVVRSVDADPDYTRRPEPETTLAFLRDLVAGH